MLLSEDLRTVLVLSPHADDEVLGCGGPMASLARRYVEVHVIHAAVDGSRHYGLDGETTYPQRLAEIEDASRLLGFSYEIAYGDKGLMIELGHGASTRARGQVPGRDGPQPSGRGTAKSGWSKPASRRAVSSAPACLPPPLLNASPSR